MIQTVLMLLAPVERLAAIPSTAPDLAKPMATRPIPAAVGNWRGRAALGLAVVANALGLLLFLAGLGLVLRLAEVLLS